MSDKKLADKLEEKYINNEKSGDYNPISFVKAILIDELENEEFIVGGLIHFFKSSAYSLVKEISNAKKGGIGRCSNQVEFLKKVCGESDIPNLGSKVYSPKFFNMWILDVSKSAEDIKNTPEFDREADTKIES